MLAVCATGAQEEELCASQMHWRFKPQGKQNLSDLASTQDSDFLEKIMECTKFELVCVLGGRSQSELSNSGSAGRPLQL